jgi:hypothetical protein
MKKEYDTILVWLILVLGKPWFFLLRVGKVNTPPHHTYGLWGQRSDLARHLVATVKLGAESSDRHSH